MITVMTVSTAVFAVVDIITVIVEFECDMDDCDDEDGDDKCGHGSCQRLE